MNNETHIQFINSSVYMFDEDGNAPITKGDILGLIDYLREAIPTSEHDENYNVEVIRWFNTCIAWLQSRVDSWA
jgi:hypothetical protein